MQNIFASQLFPRWIPNPYCIEEKAFFTVHLDKLWPKLLLRTASRVGKGFNSSVSPGQIFLAQPRDSVQWPSNQNPASVTLRHCSPFLLPVPPKCTKQMLPLFGSETVVCLHTLQVTHHYDHTPTLCFRQLKGIGEHTENTPYKKILNLNHNYKFRVSHVQFTEPSHLRCLLVSRWKLKVLTSVMFQGSAGWMNVFS